MATELCPDIVLMGVRMAGSDGIEAPRRVNRRRRPETAAG
jgi:chemotaxis response regulator CheB